MAIRTFVSRRASLLFSTLSRYVVAFLPRSSRLLIPWLQSPSAMRPEPEKREAVPASTSPTLSAVQERGRCHDLGFFLMFSFQPTPSLCSSPSLRGSLVPRFLTLEWCRPHITSPEDPHSFVHRLVSSPRGWLCAPHTDSRV